jgi:hypothetical protein
VAANSQVLGIDFGTSNTAAAIQWPDGRRRPLLLDGGPLLSSAVLLDDRGVLVTGREAIHTARSRPEWFEPNPKRRVDDGAVLLGDREVPVVELIAAVLRRVADEAQRVAPGPMRVVLTHPAAWGPQRRAVLGHAAQRAGLPAPDLVAEPVAAASYFVDVQGARVPVGSVAVVYDFGAGTFDATVVRRTPTGFEVLASEGLPDAGGLDIDAAVVGYLGTVYAARHAAEWARLQNPRTTTDRRARRLLWEDARSAKETLSRASSTLVPLPLIDEDAPVGREQLERLARPILDRTVAATKHAMDSAGVRSSTVTALFLVGGSSRIPLAATLLHTALRIAPIAIEQPELVVAEGSVSATTHGTTAGSRSGPRDGDLMGSGPMGSGPMGSGPMGSGPMGSGPISGPPASGGPVSGGPVSAAPVSGGFGGLPGGPASAGPVSGGPVSGTPAPPATDPSGSPILWPATSGPTAAGPVISSPPAGNSVSGPPLGATSGASAGPYHPGPSTPARPQAAPPPSGTQPTWPPAATAPPSGTQPTWPPGTSGPPAAAPPVSTPPTHSWPPNGTAQDPWGPAPHQPTGGPTDSWPPGATTAPTGATPPPRHPSVAAGSIGVDSNPATPVRGVASVGGAPTGRSGAGGSAADILRAEWKRLAIAAGVIGLFLIIGLTPEYGYDVFRFGVKAPVTFPAYLLAPAQIGVILLSMTAERRGVWRAVRYGLVYGGCYFLAVAAGFVPALFGLDSDARYEVRVDLAWIGLLVLGVVGLSSLVRPWSGWPARRLMPILMGVGVGFAALADSGSWPYLVYQASFDGYSEPATGVLRWFAFVVGALTLVTVAALITTAFAARISDPRLRRNISVVTGLLMTVGVVAAGIMILIR